LHDDDDNDSDDDDDDDDDNNNNNNNNLYCDLTRIRVKLASTLYFPNCFFNTLFSPICLQSVVNRSVENYH
jgi:hypothetical protein